MSVSLRVRRAIPQSLKSAFRQWSTPWRVSRLVSPYLPKTVCVDVGASYYPHGNWLIFLNSPKTEWVAVEPNEANIGYVNSWAWPCQVVSRKTGLSRDGGPQTLYVTNVDSGSSLLKPEISASMQHRIKNLDYFFPIRECRIQTLTLVQALDGLAADAPICVKLDTQGSELSILQGAQSLFQARRIIGIEMESTLLAQPIMQGSGKFWEACQFMELQGFELLLVKPIHAPRRAGLFRPEGVRYLNECDAVFAIRADIAQGLDVSYRTSLLAFYLANKLYEEAFGLVERDAGVVEFLRVRQCPLDRLTATLRILAQ